MYARLPAFVLGFHGCDRSVGEQILAGERDLAPSDNDHDWLGSGRYFWDNSYERALHFAQELKDEKRSHRNKNPIKVIGAIIDLGHCLNLLDHQALALVEAQFQELKALFTAAGKPIPVNKPGRQGSDLMRRYLDCAVIEAIHHSNALDTKRRPYDSV